MFRKHRETEAALPQNRRRAIDYPHRSNCKRTKSTNFAGLWIFSLLDYESESESESLDFCIYFTSVVCCCSSCIPNTFIAKADAKEKSEFNCLAIGNDGLTWSASGGGTEGAAISLHCRGSPNSLFMQHMCSFYLKDLQAREGNPVKHHPTKAKARTNHQIFICNRFVIVSLHMVGPSKLCMFLFPYPCSCPLRFLPCCRWCTFVQFVQS